MGQRLGVAIPSFHLLRRVLIGRGSAPGQVYAKAVDVHDPTVEVAHICAIDWDGKGVSQKVLDDRATASLQQRGAFRHVAAANLHALTPKLHFVGHYHEPALELTVDLSSAPLVDVMLSFDPYDCAWTVLSQVSVPNGNVQAPMDAVEARIPDYGEGNRNYCISMVMHSKNCDLQTAIDVIRKLFESSRNEALREAGAPGKHRISASPKRLS